MLIAISMMDPGIQAVFYGAAVALLVLSALPLPFAKSVMGLGLAAFVLPFFWNAAAAA